MDRAPRSYALDELPWTEVADVLARDPRLIVPVGTCDQYGPHLPLGAGTRVVEALADDLSREFSVLRAPTLHYGVNLPGPQPFPGASRLRPKTLHRVLNELLAVWRDQGFAEFIVISGEAHDPQVDTVAAASVEDARVRFIEPLSVDLDGELEESATPEHAGEILTSLLLHLHPELVRLDRIVDAPIPTQRKSGIRNGRLVSLPDRARQGVVGSPSRASAEKGKRMYRLILEKIRERVFLAPPPEPDPWSE
jgi:creatinine amidohydrolase